MLFSGLLYHPATLRHALLIVVAAALFIFPSITFAQPDGDTTANDYGLVVDGRTLEAFAISATLDDGTVLSQGDVLALIGAETHVPSPDSVTSFAHLEDFSALGTEVEVHSGYTSIQGLADLAAGSRSPWGVKFPLQVEGATLQVEIEVYQKLDEYFAVFVDDLFPGGKMSSAEALRATAEQLAEEVGGQLLRVYDHIIGGALIRLPPEHLPLLHQSLQVSWVDPNKTGHQTTLQAGLPNWALDRVDERFTPLDNKYDYGHDGSGVTVYVLDTGIRLTHNEFGGRATQDTDFVTTDPNVNFPNCTGNGHGTTMASLIGGEKYGVAKGVDLVAMRVLDCNGFTDDGEVAAGLNEVTAQKLANPNRPMVANLSLAMNGRDTVVDFAVSQAVNAGVVVVASAGNDGEDSCNVSPGRTAEVINVGAVESQGDRWDDNDGTSAFGTCIDLYAPGKNVKGANNGTNSGSTSVKGTSPAAALVSGMAARYLSVYPDATPQQVETALVAAATSGVLNNLGNGSPDLMLFWDEEQVPGVVYRSHVRGFAWLTWVSNGAMTGSTGQSRRTEAFEIKLNDLPAGIGICYNVDSRNQGWTGVQCDGQMAGTTGQNLRAERIKIWLTGNTAAGCSVNYRAHVGNSGWQAPKSNGGIAGVDGERIEALEVSLTPQCMQVPPPPPVPPVAHCTAIPNYGQSTVHSTLDASGSYDPNGTIVSYQWNLGLGNAVTFNHTFTNVGNAPASFPVSVTVTDNDGLTDTDYCPVIVECPPSNPPCPQ